MVSYELGEELRKMFFRLVTSVGKEKILSPHEESNLRPSDLRSDALPLSHWDSSVGWVDARDKTKKHLPYCFFFLETSCPFGSGHKRKKVNRSSFKDYDRLLKREGRE